MMRNIAISTERYDLHRLVSAAIKAANSHSVDRCFDILRYLKSLRLSVKDLCSSKSILPLESLRDHGNPKIRMEVHVLFNSWMKTLYSSGRSDLSTTCNKAIPLNMRIKSDVVKVCSELKKKKHQISHDIATVTKKKTEFLRLKKNEDEKSQDREINQIDDSKSFAKKPLQTQKQTPLPVKVAENPKSCQSLKSVRDNTCKATPTKSHEAGEIKKNLKKPDVRKSVSTTSRPLQTKKQMHIPLKVSGNPKSCPALKKNATEMLELFEIAKKSADVANAKGLLAAKAETSICVDTLALLISFPISSTAIETRQIMEKLERLTKHKDRKICNSASELLHHWRQSIRNQQHEDARKTRG